MGKKHLNPVLSAPIIKIEPTPRKIRSDKLHDIKIPITETLDTIIRRESKKNWNGSKTSLGTDIFLFSLVNIFSYPKSEYKDGPYTVHIKVDHDIYKKIGDYAAKWKCSIRKAAHRIFIEGIKKKQLGGITDEIL